MINKLTEKLFWETWPEVAIKCSIDTQGVIRLEPDSLCYCPIVATAKHLGIPGAYRNFSLGPVLNMINGGYPKWVQNVIRASDNNISSIIAEPKLISTRLRLLKPMQDTL